MDTSDLVAMTHQEFWQYIWDNAPYSPEQYDTASWVADKIMADPALFSKALDSLPGYFATVFPSARRHMWETAWVACSLAGRSWSGRRIANTLLEFEPVWETMKQSYVVQLVRDCILTHAAITDAARLQRIAKWIEVYPKHHHTVVGAHAGALFQPENRASVGGRLAVRRAASYRPALQHALIQEFGLNCTHVNPRLAPAPTVGFTTEFYLGKLKELRCPDSRGRTGLAAFASRPNTELQ